MINTTFGFAGAALATSSLDDAAIVRAAAAARAIAPRAPTMRVIRHSDTRPRPKLRISLGVILIVLMLPGAADARWRPKPTTSPWQWQLTGRVDVNVRARVFDIDGLRAKASTVRALHRRGRRAVCYIAVGTYEPFRADAKRFPPELLGRRVAGFPDERWLDIRRIDLLAPVLRARLDTCARKGFDGVEPD